MHPISEHVDVLLDVSYRRLVVHHHLTGSPTLIARFSQAVARLACRSLTKQPQADNNNKLPPTLPWCQHQERRMFLLSLQHTLNPSILLIKDPSILLLKE